MLPAGCTIICSMKSVHQYWSKPDLWQPERFMPGGEFDTFEEGIRPYMVCGCASGLPSSTLLANSLSLALVCSSCPSFKGHEIVWGKTLPCWRLEWC